MFTFYYARAVDHVESQNLWRFQIVRVKRIAEKLFEDVHLDFVRSFATASDLASGLNK